MGRDLRHLKAMRIAKRADRSGRPVLRAAAISQAQLIVMWVVGSWRSRKWMPGIR